MNPASILIADDHSIIRKTIRDWLGKKYPWIVMLEARTGEEVLRILQAVSVDLILMDIHFPGMTGVDATKIIKEKHPDIPIVIVTVQEDDHYQMSAIAAGADGYVIKRNMYSDLIPVIAPLIDKLRTYALVQENA